MGLKILKSSNFRAKNAQVLESKSESAGKQGFVNYFVSYSLIFFSKKPKSLNVCIRIDQLIQLMAYSWNYVFMSAVTLIFSTMGRSVNIFSGNFLTPLYRGSSLHTVSVHTDSHHTVFSGPPRQGFDGFYGTLNFKNLL